MTLCFGCCESCFEVRTAELEDTTEIDNLQNEELAPLIEQLSDPASKEIPKLSAAKPKTKNAKKVTRRIKDNLSRNEIQEPKGLKLPKQETRVHSRYFFYDIYRGRLG